jgi:hypothetical protein
LIIFQNRMQNNICRQASRWLKLEDISITVIE